MKRKKMSDFKGKSTKGHKMNHGLTQALDTFQDVCQAILMLAIMAWLHEPYVGIMLAFVAVLVGNCMNLVVCGVNGGRMPVRRPDSDYLRTSATHCPATAESRLLILADIIPIGKATVSIGDVVGGVGQLSFVVQLALVTWLF